MRVRYLKALEEERFDALPGRTYARAFLRTYANALGLQADAFVDAFDRQVPEPPEPEVVVVRRRSVLRDSWRFAPAAAAVAVLTIFFWSAWSSGGGHPAPVATLSTAAARPAAPVTHVLAARHTTVQPLVVRATTGPCWVEARRGSATGPVLLERTLQTGESARFTARRVWLRLGAPWNASVRRGAHLMRLPAVQRPVNVAY